VKSLQKRDVLCVKSKSRFGLSFIVSHAKSLEGKSEELKL